MDNETANAYEIWRQLSVLKLQTASTGLLFDAQILQLKHWGLLAVPYADQVTFKWDNANLKGKTITYEARVKFDPPEDQVELVKKSILPGLERSVHQLLGDDWSLEVYINGELVHNGIR